MKAFEHKKCLFCGSKQVKKNGTHDGKQRYKCTACNKRFSGGSRLDPDTPLAALQ
ncbi:transposase-like zinc-binding domain-containing protein [Cardiobacterium valvarum]|uniref:transposase-like zinc-binding domain-containing protein n=1 Tax=Cardiobacterium valvarum TaxID=194702 RepID=UPI000E20C2EB